VLVVEVQQLLRHLCLQVAVAAVPRHRRLAIVHRPEVLQHLVPRVRFGEVLTLEQAAARTRVDLVEDALLCLASRRLVGHPQRRRHHGICTRESVGRCTTSMHLAPLLECYSIL
jgi:hypothetical protein